MKLRLLTGKRAFTLIEVLVVILITGILLAVALPALLGQSDKAHDSVVRQHLTSAYHAGKPVWTEEGEYPPPGSLPTAWADPETLIGALQGSEPQLVFSDQTMGVAEDDPTVVQVTRLTEDAVVYTAASRSGRVWCLENVERNTQTAAGVPVAAGLYWAYGTGEFACGEPDGDPGDVVGGTSSNDSTQPVSQTNPQMPGNPVVTGEYPLPIPLPTPIVVGAGPSAGPTPPTGLPSPTPEPTPSPTPTPDPTPPPLTQPAGTDVDAVTSWVYRGTAQRPLHWYGDIGCTGKCADLWNAEQQLTATDDLTAELNRQIRLLRAAAHPSNYASQCQAMGASSSSSFTLPSDGIYRVRYYTTGDYSGDGNAKPKLITYEVPQPNDSPAWNDSSFRLHCFDPGNHITPGGANYTLTEKSFIYRYSAVGQSGWTAVNHTRGLYTNPPSRMDVLYTTGAGWGSYSDTIAVYYRPDNGFKQVGPVRDWEPGMAYDRNVYSTWDYGSSVAPVKSALQTALLDDRYALALQWLQYQLGNYPLDPVA